MRFELAPLQSHRKKVVFFFPGDTIDMPGTAFHHHSTLFPPPPPAVGVELRSCVSQADLVSDKSVDSQEPLPMLRSVLILVGTQGSCEPISEWTVPEARA